MGYDTYAISRYSVSIVAGNSFSHSHLPSEKSKSMKNTSQQIIYGNSTITPSANANRILNDKVQAIEVNKYQLNRDYKSIEESKFYKKKLLIE